VGNEQINDCGQDDRQQSDFNPTQGNMHPADRGFPIRHLRFVQFCIDMIGHQNKHGGQSVQNEIKDERGP